MAGWRLALRLLGAVTSFGASAAAVSDPLVRVGRDQLCVTDGDVSVGPGGALWVSTPEMRAVVPTSSRQDVEARFAFLGPTDQIVALGSGTIREQFGLKLRAADPCNLVYAMWRFSPKPGVAVQLKSNPGEHDSQTCHNHGYRDIEPSVATAVDAPVVGRTYRLKAEMEASTLKVSIDGRVVWRGELGAEALLDEGPVGIRSDNARLSLTLYAPIGSTPAAAPPPHCRPGGGE